MQLRVGGGLLLVGWLIWIKFKGDVICDIWQFIVFQAAIHLYLTHLFFKLGDEVRGEEATVVINEDSSGFSFFVNSQFEFGKFFIKLFTEFSAAGNFKKCALIDSRKSGWMCQISEVLI